MYRLILVVLAAVVFFSGCKKEETTPGFDMIYQQEFTIPAGVGGFVTHHFYFDNLSTRYEALLSQYGKTDEEVLRILPAQASLAGIFGDLDFSIVEEVSLRVYTNSDKTDYIESAYRYPTPINPSNTLDLLPSLADCKRVMADNRFGIDLAIRLRNTTTDEMPVHLSLQFKANY